MSRVNAYLGPEIRTRRRRSELSHTTASFVTAGVRSGAIEALASSLVLGLSSKDPFFSPACFEVFAPLAVVPRIS